jgi:hypothetical protein
MNETGEALKCGLTSRIDFTDKTVEKFNAKA